MTQLNVQINGDWKKVTVNAGDEITFNQVVEAAGFPAGHGRVFRIEYTGAVGPGGVPIDGILREGGSVKIRDEVTKFTATPSSQT